MSKRTAFLAILLIVGPAGAPFAATWTGGGGDNSWFNPGNWSNGRLPRPTDVIEFSDRVERGPVIDGDVSCGEFQGPCWNMDGKQVVDIADGNVVVNGRWRFGNKGDGTGIINISGGNTLVRGDVHLGDYAYGIINMTGGAFRCQSLQIGDDGDGEIHISGDGVLDVAKTVKLGGVRGTGPLIVTLNGGLLRIGGALLCPSNKSRAGSTKVEIKAGAIECGSLSHAGVAYSLNIEEGELIIRGDVTEELKDDVAKGYIRAFGGRQKVAIEYDADQDRAVVMASARRKAWRPEPAQQAIDVRPDVTLRWNRGAGAAAHNFYFGARPAAVKPGAKPVVSKLKARTFQPRMEFGRTYYWRVDTVQEDGRVLRGAVWRFQTSDGKVSLPSPASFAEYVESNTALEWTPAIAATSYNVYLGTDRRKVESATSLSGTVTGTVFKPRSLKPGEKYYWRVDAINSRWRESPWKGDVWQFTVDRGNAREPEPLAGAQWIPTALALKWTAPRSADAFDVYFGSTPEAVADGAEPVSLGQNLPTYAVRSLARATTYYWRVDTVSNDGIVKGDVWTFSTIGKLHLKVDLALPTWENPAVYHPATAKPGWAIWAAPRWADMYMHDPVWFPKDGPGKKGILGSPVTARISNGGGGNGALHAHGLARGGLAGDKPPYGKIEGDPIANTYFYACDWAGPQQGDILLLLAGLPAGDYEVVSYHNFWEPTAQQTRNRREAPNQMPPMPTVTVHGAADIPAAEYGRQGTPRGPGTGITNVRNAENVKVASALSDAEVSTSLVKFTTDGKVHVLIVYKAPNNGYADRARSGREGGRGILNAFEVRLVGYNGKAR